MSPITPACSPILLTASDVAARLQISQRQVYNLIAQGGFPPPFKVGRQNRWREQEITDYLDRLANNNDASEKAA